ncbi:Ribonuclease H [Rhodococcus sp. AW25M09]|uniref:nuclear transport factor 2 family protein n=1 Tax=Rhodococcus sp. AW25M09 TaxID=1268303 RepID=UPI0002ABAF10|nr:nuclear transport factor 2 family protein [Rhodococcus sp. AW25M09]CCQ15183.1 Ribonuclease H [Rhodococcus sp. AW25M09]
MPHNISDRPEPCADLTTVLALERELQTAECRRDRARLELLLADDFTETGASGALWTKQSILEMLGSEDSGEEEIEVHDLTGRLLGPGFVLIRWVSNRSGNRARRSSLWRSGPSGWQLAFHQGTPLISWLTG